MYVRMSIYPALRIRIPSRPVSKGKRYIHGLSLLPSALETPLTGSKAPIRVSQALLHILFLPASNHCLCTNNVNNCAPVDQQIMSTSDCDHQGSISNLIDVFFSETNPDGTVMIRSAEPLDIQVCLTEMIRFVRVHRLEAIFGYSNEELEVRLLPQAQIISQLSVKLRYINSQLAMPLAIASLYDLAVLVGRCISWVTSVSTLKDNN